MDEHELLSRFGLVPDQVDLPEVRRRIELLTAEKERSGNEPLKTLCVQLFAAGDPSDALLIYEAKMSSFDAGCYIDLELTCGAGLQRTMRFLEKSGDPDAKRLLRDLRGGLSLEDFTPQSHLYFYRRYYGLTTKAEDLAMETYPDQLAKWPMHGRHILAHWDAETIIVYQAYRPSIADYLTLNGMFGGDFSYQRMSWIKPNFYWMMHRSGWGTKEGQERILGLRLRRAFFERILNEAVISSFDASDFPTREAWKAALEVSDVRLQWDPDHDPTGNAVPRRAIQLGLRGAMLEEYGQNQLLEIIDMTDFVCSQREHLHRFGTSNLRTPLERTYVPDDATLARRLRLD